MTDIAIIGYGKMGKRIAELAPEMGCRVVVVIDDEAGWKTNVGKLPHCDVALEFTTPEVAPSNVKRLLLAGINVVCGTTGWHDKVGEMAEIAVSKGVGLMVESNFSIGMRAFIKVNRHLGELMKGCSGYTVSLEEIHHVHKLDAPSGTAKILAEDLRKTLITTESVKGISDRRDRNSEIPVTSVREGEVVGVHEVTWTGKQDKISIRHEALNRDGFVTGALAAACWIKGKSGLHTMEQMLFGNQ